MNGVKIYIVRESDAQFHDYEGGGGLTMYLERTEDGGFIIPARYEPEDSPYYSKFVVSSNAHRIPDSVYSLNKDNAVQLHVGFVYKCMNWPVGTEKPTDAMLYIWRTDETPVRGAADEIVRVPLEKVGDYARFKLPRGAKWAAFGYAIKAPSDRPWVDSTAFDFSFSFVPRETNAHFSKLKRKIAKESGQQYFRDTIDGTISFFGQDYDYLQDTDLNDPLRYEVHVNGSVVANGSFFKGDCNIDHFKKKAEVKLEPRDRYTDLLNGYDNTYNLISEGVKVERLTMHKNCCVQLYIPGSDTITNIIGGAVYEKHVEDIVFEEIDLIDKYHFAPGPYFNYAIVTRFSNPKEIIGTFLSDPYSPVWESPSICYDEPSRRHEGEKDQKSIVFSKEYDAGDYIEDIDAIKNLSGLNIDPSWMKKVFSNIVGSAGTLRVPVYRIYMYEGPSGTGRAMYKSSKLYPLVYSSYMSGPSYLGGFSLGSTGISMERADDSMTWLDPNIWLTYPGSDEWPRSESFSFHVFARVLTNADTAQGGGAAPVPIGADETFGYSGVSSYTTVAPFWEVNPQYGDGLRVHASYEHTYRETPLLPNYAPNAKNSQPIMPNIWRYGRVNRDVYVGGEVPVSLWFAPTVTYGGVTELRYGYKYTLKDAYSIANIIKTLLRKVAPNLTHERSPEYSQFLYGNSLVGLGQKALFLTQKSNLLKMNYSQAATKAEITLKNVLDMLVDCFNCYWYVDDNNRFIIEHIYYFQNGFSYEGARGIEDMDSKKDKFNSKMSLFGQRRVSYDTSSIINRFEYRVEGGVSKVMGADFYADAISKAKFVKKVGKTKVVDMSKYNADVDMMLASPNDFSKDNYALLLAYSDNYNVTSEYVKAAILMGEEPPQIIDTYPVNGGCSAYSLLRRYRSHNISVDMQVYGSPDIAISVQSEAPYMSQTFSIPDMLSEGDAYKVWETNVGFGMVDSITTELDTGVSTVKVVYTPK